MSISRDFSKSSHSSNSESFMHWKLGLQSHYLSYQKKKVQNGKSKGQTKYIVSLEIGLYMFIRRVDATKIWSKALLSCKLCSDIGFETYASAIKTKVDHDEPFYELIQCPV